MRSSRGTGRDEGFGENFAAKDKWHRSQQKKTITRRDGVCFACYIRVEEFYLIRFRFSFIILAEGILPRFF